MLVHLLAKRGFKSAAFRPMEIGEDEHLQH